MTKYPAPLSDCDKVPNSPSRVLSEKTGLGPETFIPRGGNESYGVSAVGRAVNRGHTTSNNKTPLSATAREPPKEA